ncbi:MAG: hypothetical protein J0I47_12740 [Sphingomonas sp.]|uniref:hypothetical protein n=1 Tax=Sphingomonas sp. TaxID=28214 RepID=UPI001AC1FE0B|nr:hypothetical protein [Sphingomonas sp.]MBN8809084.1 hypothetical protein [Sphingomonas sp.]
MDESNEQKTGTRFEDTVRAVGEDVVEALDAAVDHTAKFIGGDNGNKVVGGAAVGALAAVVLPISLVGGAILGAGYALLRKNR